MLKRFFSRRPSHGTVVAYVALFITLSGVAYAADTVGSSDIIDEAILSQDIKNGEVKTSELANSGVTNGKLALNSVGTGKVIDNSLTGADLKGADVSGATISFAAGAVANGRCKNSLLSVAGAKAGEAVVVSLQGVAPEGLLFYGVRVPADNQVTLKLCDFTGVASPAVSNLPVRVFTFG
jgi:hypothetical protein